MLFIFQRTVPKKITSAFSLFFLLPVLLFFPGCGGEPKDLSPSEKAREKVQRMEKMLLRQGIDYRGELLGPFLLRGYQEMNEWIKESANEEEKRKVEKEFFRLKCFLGMLVIFAFQGGYDITENFPKDVLGPPPDITRQIPAASMDNLSFFPAPDNIISVRSILEYYRGIRREIPDYSFAYSLPASFLLLYGDWNDASELARAALERSPRDFVALRTLAVIYLVRQKTDREFLSVIRRLKEVTGKGYLVDYLLSRTARDAGDLPVAIHYAEQALSRVRDIQLILYAARLEETVGNLEKARYYYSLLLGMGQYAGREVYKKAEQEIARIAELMKKK